MSKKSIVFLASSIGFPYGMAGTERVKLLGLGMIENGLDVRVLHLRISERPHYIRNISANGEFRGIKFEYTTGNTTRSPKFLTRRAVEIRGTLIGLKRLAELKSQGKLDYVYFYGGVLQFTALRLLFILYARLLNVPIAIDLCERPWSLDKAQKGISGSVSPLSSVNGVVAISEYLKEWACSEGKRIRNPVKILKVPILVDIWEHTNFSDSSSNNHQVLYAASPEYIESFKFVLKAMEYVWLRVPHSRLVLTGIEPQTDSRRRITDMVEKSSRPQNVQVMGYLTRPMLHAECARSNALLAPLDNDIRSRARFPTKIAEYMAAKRPVVTNFVGEVGTYLSDGENAFVCEPGDPHLYGEKILAALLDYRRAGIVGANGWKCAHDNFHYQMHGPRLVDFLLKLST